MLENNINTKLKSDYDEIYAFLIKNNYKIPDIPKKVKPRISDTFAIAKAYGIQGILKYHGLFDPKQRIAFNCSVSINNSSVATYSYLALSHKKDCFEDRIIINGKQLDPREKQFERAQSIVNFVRNLFQTDFTFFLISRNLDPESNRMIFGKGMGTSASAGAALTQALMESLFTDEIELIENYRLKSVIARHLAGSAARSMVGGIGLWLNYPGIDSFDSFAIRMDRQNDYDFLNSVSLISIEIESNIKTDTLHSLAPHSIFYENWLLDRKSRIFQLIEAMNKKDLELFGSLAEFDTNCLHAISSTASIPPNPPLISPITHSIIQFVHLLRDEGFQVYYSIDTGPSIVLLCPKKHQSEILTRLLENSPNLKDIISVGQIAGSAETIKENAKLPELFKEDLERYAEY